MTLLEMKKKVLQLIEEIDEAQDSLTNDPDISAKMNAVINQVMYELARMKKIPTNTTVEVTRGQVLDLNTLDNFYQARLIRFDGGYDFVENLVVFAADGEANVFYYKYPERITDETPDDYEFELSQDALEIMPYGVAGDLLKIDVSTQYGAIYSQRYETMLQRLDPRYSLDSFSIEGGIEI